MSSGTKQPAGTWMLLAGLGMGLGSALHCQAPTNHLRLDAGENCVTCHRSDFEGAAQPLHLGVMPQDCASCHGHESWSPATGYEHSIPLEGAHASVECNACHTGEPPVYVGTATECVGCHRADYEASPFPGHAEFATTCHDCHTTSGWVPASGAHPQDRFSITGTHDYACNECHNPSLGPNGAGNSDCVGCHEGEHTLAEMDDKHTEAQDYPTGLERAPSFCLECHADGR